MSALRQAPKLFNSGPFSFDLGTRQLTKNGADIEINGRPLRIFELLLAAPGQVVTRSQLKTALWPGTARIDTERRLNTAVRALREALGDQADAPEFVETVRGQGYRWIAKERSEPRVRIWQRWAVAAAACFALLLIGPVQEKVTGAGLAHDQSAQFLRIVAVSESEPASAAADLEMLIENRPDFRAAQILRAELAMRAWREAPSKDLLAASKAALAKAATVAGEDPDLNVLAAELALYADWDWAAAERFYQRAVARDPKHAGAHKGLAWLYLNSGREEAVWAELDLLMGEVELTDGLRADIGWLLLRMGRDDLALAMCSDAIKTHVNTLSCRHTALARRGAFNEARNVALAVLDAMNLDQSVVETIHNAPAEIGYQRFLEWRTDNFLPEGGNWFQRAQLQAEAGSLEAALTSLEQAYLLREPSMVKLKSTPEFADLNGSLRYQSLLSKVYQSAAG